MMMMMMMMMMMIMVVVVVVVVLMYSGFGFAFLVQGVSLFVFARLWAHKPQRVPRNGIPGPPQKKRVHQYVTTVYYSI